MAEEKQDKPKRSSAKKAEELSPADLELSSRIYAPIGGGDPITVKVNPEVPSQAQVDAASQEIASLDPLTVTVNDEEYEATQDDAGQFVSRVLASNTDHPANTTPGWSNPMLSDPTDEDKEADNKAYAGRFS